MAPQLEALTRAHDVRSFDCGTPALNRWLQTTAMQHQKNGISRTFVKVDEGQLEKILGFVTLAIRTMTPADDLPAEMRKRLPGAVPGYTLARLAVDIAAQGQGLGEHLLLEAMERAYYASASMGGYALFVDAKEGAASFYEKYGFVPLPDDPHILVMPMAGMPDFSELGQPKA
jgi:ribosomal protein S18 acetylase RimI-like enzyme